jgi:glycine C-acetyltransferase
MRGQQEIEGNSCFEICFVLLVDDAHGFGTLGKTGAGAGEEQDCQDGDVYFLYFCKMANIGAL